MNATTYTTTRIGRNGKALPGSPSRRYATTTAAHAAYAAARASLTPGEYASAEAQRYGDVWTFTPTTGSPVRIRVTQDA